MEHGAYFWDVIYFHIQAIEAVTKVRLVELYRSMRGKGKKDFAENPTEDMS